MPDRPSALWKELPLDKRVAAAEAFWRDEESPDIEAQQVEVIVSLARRLKFRPKSVLALPIERRARALAQMPDVSDAVATRALIAYHFAAQRPLMAAFLDAVGLAHDNGLITEENPAAPDAEKAAAAIAAVKSSFDPGDVDFYLRTLLVLDGDTWKALEDLVTPAG